MFKRKKCPYCKGKVKRHKIPMHSKYKWYKCVECLAVCPDTKGSGI